MADLGSLAGRVITANYAVPLVASPAVGATFVRTKRMSRQIWTPSTPLPMLVRTKVVRRSSLAFNYIPTMPFLSGTASFSGVVKLNGNPLGDCIIRCYDLETGIEHGRSTIDFLTGAYTINNLVSGRAYTLVVASRVYNSTRRVVQIGIITA